MDALVMLLRVGAVFALLGATLWVLRRTDRGARSKSGTAVQVLGSARLGKGASLTVVRIGDEQVILGVTEHNVSLLGAPTPSPEAALAPAAVTAPAAAPARSDFAGLLAARLGLAPRDDAAAPAAPPTMAAFLRNAYRPPTADVSDAAVAAALANVRGDALPAPRSSSHDAAPAAAAPSPSSPQAGSALPDPHTRAVLHRAVLRTRALSAVTA